MRTLATGPLTRSSNAPGSEFAMGLRPTHVYESALPRFIDSKRGCHATFDGVSMGRRPTHRDEN